MPSNELATILPPQDFRSTDPIVRRWIVLIAEVCGKEVTRTLVESWCRLLSDIEPDLLDRALEETAKTCGQFFPTPGDVRARIIQANAKGIELEAAEAWERALKVAERDSALRELDAKTQHAVRAAGGLRLIESCSCEQLQWARKRFIEDYKLLHETGQLEHLITDGEAKKILRQIAKQMDAPERKGLIASAGQKVPSGHRQGS